MCNLFTHFSFCLKLSTFYTKLKLISILIENLVNLEDLSNIEQVILLFSKLSYFLDRNLSRINGEDFLEVLGEIGTTGTRVFRDWCNNEFKIELDPLEYISLDKNFEI